MYLLCSYQKNTHKSSHSCERMDCLKSSFKYEGESQCLSWWINLYMNGKVLVWGKGNFWLMPSYCMASWSMTQLSENIWCFVATEFTYRKITLLDVFSLSFFFCLWCPKIIGIIFILTQFTFLLDRKVPLPYLKSCSPKYSKKWECQNWEVLLPKDQQWRITLVERL